MKLKNGLILQDVGNEHMAVASGDAAKAFNGLIRNNDTANFIFKQLQNETTEEKICSEMTAKYDAPADVIKKDVHEIIEKIRQANLLDE